MAQPKNARRLEYVPLDDVKPAKRNPKLHDVEALDASLDRFGFTEPVLLDERTGRLVAGHGRLERLRQAQRRGDPAPEGIQVLRDGTWKLPVIRGWASRDDAEAEAYLVASNRIVETGGWDLPELADLLGAVQSTDLGLEGVGYDPQDLDDLLASLELPEPEPEPVDDEPIEPPAKPVTRAGDVWLLGPHRIICGSSRDPETVAKLLDGASINLAFTSPPYADRRKYDETTEFRPIPPDEYVEWFEPVAAIVAQHLAEDGSWFVNIRAGGDGLDKETYVLDLVLAHAREWGWHWVEEYCWERPGVPKAVVMRFKNAWESVHQFTRGRFKFRPDEVRHQSANVPFSPKPGDPLYGNPEGRQGRKRTGGVASYSLQTEQGTNSAPGTHIGDGMAYPSNRLPPMSGSHEATGHAAAFPVGLPEFFVKAYTDEGDTVYDPFMGSGSTLLAAHQQNRIGYGVEISPRYCDVICARFERHTGIVPVLERTGKPRSFAPRAQAR